ncbi:MAG TPA: hypothetical protein VHJ37_08880, partial [Thermoleophilaceae bacterium]|nr:hypothetical protein [Thermoleophilaceae bacterium]
RRLRRGLGQALGGELVGHAAPRVEPVGLVAGDLLDPRPRPVGVAARPVLAPSTEGRLLGDVLRLSV